MVNIIVDTVMIDPLINILLKGTFITSRAYSIASGKFLKVTLLGIMNIYDSNACSEGFRDNETTQISGKRVIARKIITIILENIY
jgi:hypothetical protein